MQFSHHQQTEYPFHKHRTETHQGRRTVCNAIQEMHGLRLAGGELSCQHPAACTSASPLMPEPLVHPTYCTGLGCPHTHKPKPSEGWRLPIHGPSSFCASTQNTDSVTVSQGLPGPGALLKAADVLQNRRNAALGLQGPAPAEGDMEQAELGQKRNGAEALQTLRAESCGHTDAEPDWPRRRGPELKEGLLWIPHSKKPV